MATKSVEAKAERCRMSGKTQSVPWDDWAGAETCVCNVCGHTVKFRVRGTDLPPWGRVLAHRVDGTPTR